MREKKKSLKLRKFKIASFEALWLKGGDSFPCVLSPPTQAGLPTDDCCTEDNSTCSHGQYLSAEENSCDFGPPPRP